MTFDEFQKLALSLPEATEQPHFDKPSFRVNNKIFATYWSQENKAMLRLSPVDQSVFCGYDGKVFYPVNGSWGQKGATFVDLDSVRRDMFKDALNCAYSYLAPRPKSRDKS